MNTTKVSRIIRMSLLVALMAVLAFLCVVRLLQIQIVDANLYSEQIKETFTATQTIQAVRGRIVDSEGLVLNTNEIVYKVILQRAFLPFGGENEVIAQTLTVLAKHDSDWIDSLPVSMTPNPFTGRFLFKNVIGDELDNFKVRLGLNYDATVENCIKALAENYNIDTKKYDEQMIRYIGGIRYEMELRDFSFQNRYILAEDIPMEVIIELKEKAITLKGVDIVEEPIRIYNEGAKLPHIRGRINAINQEQYAVLKDSGYSLNDTIGFFGLEETMESVLRGENGIREITRDSSWEIISDEITKPVHAGDTVKLTIDTEFQKKVEEILANHIKWSNQPGNITRRPWTKTTAGSIVVLDVTTGAILALANNPSYDLNDHVDLMLAEAAGEPPLPEHPLRDRSIGHGYRPGSAFKTVTGTAGLISGTVGRSDTVHCSGVYNVFSGTWRPRCHSVHGNVNAPRALLESCNIYYYEISRRMKIEPLVETASLFGVGTNLNCDVPMTTGRMTTPEVYYDLAGHEMGQGDLIQIAIGQSETLLTPLHMATVAMTIANNGVRYRPYLVDSVWNYDATRLLHKTQTEVVEDFSVGNEDAFKTVQDGMRSLAVRNQAQLFAFLPDLPAYKTGTPEIEAGKLYNSTVLGYYPFENPKIAFAVVMEGGEYATRAARNVIDLYFYGHYEPSIDERGNIRNAWQRWTQPYPQAIPGRYNDSE
ncbi:MAG: penicillin-binding transpeptidase domain-containing protein [Oscillospiraceae bacterium]|nr:penicillin-binding transpeptidase domain-containing protein [Oscillospiraceae bacterium]